MFRFQRMSYLFFFLFSLPAFAQEVSISSDSIDAYFSKLSPIQRLTRENIEFLKKNNTSSNTRVFKFFLQNARSIDSVVSEKGYSQGYTDFLITRDEIDCKLWQDLDIKKPVSENPDWDQLKKQISRNYTKATAERNIIGAQLRWYGYKKDTANLIRYTVEKIDRYGLDTAGLGRSFTNNMIFELIFMHSDDASVLRKAAGWMKIIIDSEPPAANHIDTYANLMYKLGNRSEAIKWQQKAITLNSSDEEMKKNLNKMVRGLPTWETYN